MKNVKRLSVLTILLALALVFTGCTNGELKLYNAFLKSQDIRSMESEVELAFTLEGEGLSEENQVMLKEVSDFLNNYKMTMKQNMEGNEDGTIVKAQVDSIIDMGGIKTDLSIWMDIDASKDVPEIKYVIKVPQMLMAMAGEEFAELADKEYIAYDYSEIMEASGMDIDNAGLMEWAKDMEPLITKFLEEYMKGFNSDVKMIQSKGQRVIDREVFDIYELKLNDEDFKTLVRNSVNEFMGNEDMKRFMAEYMEMVFKLMENQNEEESEEIKKELEEFKKELDKQIPNMKANFNKFMDKFDEVTILGEEGIVMEYAINKYGYIVGEKGSINLILDLELLGMEGLLKLRIDSNLKNLNINGDVKVEMPELNEENTFNLIDILKDM